MASKKKPSFSRKMKIEPSLPPKLKTYLKTADLDSGRAALKRFRRSGELPKSSLGKGESGFSKEWGGAGKMMRGEKRARRRR